jgi:hypothetical protein
MFWIENRNLLFLRPPYRTHKLQEKPSILKREHPALQNIKNLYFFYICGSFLPYPIRIRSKMSRIQNTAFPYILNTKHDQSFGSKYFNGLSSSTQFYYSDLKLKLIFSLFCLQRTSCRWCTCTRACWLSTCSQPSSPAFRPSPGTSTSIPAISPFFW